MTKELARNILVHFDDLVWQRDNGITPESIAEAIGIAVEALTEPGAGDTKETDTEENRIVSETRAVRLDMTGLSIRATNGLSIYGIVTMEDLIRCTKKFIGRLQNIGKQTIAEIESTVRAKGLELGALPAIYVMGHFPHALKVYMTDDSETHCFGTKQEAMEFIRKENGKILG